MNILIVGSGGREHAFAWKISQSPKLSQLFIAPGNAGTSDFGTNVEIGVTDFAAIRTLVIEKNIAMVVVGPEVPLVEGIHDFFLADKILKKIPVIGPVSRGHSLHPPTGKVRPSAGGASAGRPSPRRRSGTLRGGV